MKQISCRIRNFPTNLLLSENCEDLESKLISNERTSHHKVKKCILLIPGNPGGLSYYTPFCERLESHLDDDVKVLAIDHFGHCKVQSWVDSIKGTFSPASLSDQMDHKKAFVEDHLPSAESLVIIGHSIGALMMLKLVASLKQNSRFDSVCGIGLFPTVERMADSPMGKKMTPVFAYLRWFAVFFAAIFAALLPKSLRLKTLRWYFGPKVEENSIMATDDIACARAVSGIMNMAHYEMREVAELDVKLIEDTCDSVFLYYGSRDAWTPRSYYESIKKTVPGVKAKICDKKFAHAFVLRHSLPVGDMCAGWVKQIFDDPTKAFDMMSESGANEEKTA